MSPLVLALGAALANPPLPVPPTPRSPPMSKVDVGGATIVFPHGARKLPRMTPSQAAAIREQRLQFVRSKLPNMDTKIVEEGLALAEQSDSWDGADPDYAEGYGVIVGPRPPSARPSCPAAPRPRSSCQLVHAGTARGDLVRRETADGGVTEMLSLYTPEKSYLVRYFLYGPSSRPRLRGAAPGSLANGERFIRSFRLAGQPVVLGGASH